MVSWIEETGGADGGKESEAGGREKENFKKGGWEAR